MRNYTTTQKILSYILKIFIVIPATVGTFFSVYDSRNSFMGGTNVFMYFTIQSNIAVAILAMIGAYYLAKDRAGAKWAVVQFVGTVSITLTGIVFSFVLAPTLGDQAWNPKNVLTHVVVPVMAIIDFFVVGRSFTISRKKVMYVIIPPLLYAIYAGIAYVQGWQFAEGICYPYFFLNWGSPAGAFGFTKGLPFMGCVWWILAIFLFLIGVGLLYLQILRGLSKRKM